MSKKFYVYALLCQDTPSDPGYVKFGKSCNIGSRLAALRCGCPIPARYFAIIEIRDERRQALVEKDLHEIFAKRLVSGEWFRFDFASNDDKQDFHAGCRVVIERYASGLDQKKWSFINVKSLDEYSRGVNVSGRKNLGREKERRRRTISAWRELGAYGA